MNIQDAKGKAKPYQARQVLLAIDLLALAGIRKVVAGVVSDMKRNREDIPAPLAEKAYSGQFKVRIPPQVHRALALQAAEEGVSLNRLASAKLSATH